MQGEEIGTCPNGQMNVQVISAAWVQVTYTINQPPHATSRVTYFPNTRHGLKVIKLMKVAWERRLVFSIGTSLTTGQQNTVIWTIHHKTALSGGAANHGYPDDEYLHRVTEELAERGVV